MNRTATALFLALFGGLAPTRATAEGSRAAPVDGVASRERAAPVAVVVMGAESDAAREVEARLEQRARALGRRVLDDAGALRSSEADDAGAIDAALVDRLAEVEADLARARELAAGLLEGEALAVLERARAKLEALLALPGASHWAAELDALEAIVAHQAGLVALAEHRLRSAATLDPARSLGRAEAPPELVERARAIAQAVAASPRGSFVVRADAPGATVHLDDVAIGPAGARVVAAVGVHLLRVEAPGHRPYARRIEVLEGSRPEIAVRLAPDRFTTDARRAIGAARRGDLEATRAPLANLAAQGAPLELWVALASSDGARALLTRCDARGCEAASPMDGAELAEPTRPRPPALDPFAGNRDYLLGAPEAGEPPETRRRRWPRALLFTALGVAVAGGVTAAIVATRPEPAPELVTTIDFGDLARRAP